MPTARASRGSLLEEARHRAGLVKRTSAEVNRAENEQHAFQ